MSITKRLIKQTKEITESNSYTASELKSKILESIKYNDKKLYSLICGRLINFRYRYNELERFETLWAATRYIGNNATTTKGIINIDNEHIKLVLLELDRDSIKVYKN